MTKELAVVIGAGGMGASVARRMARQYQVLLADIDAQRADAVARMVCDEGGSASGVHCDVTIQDSVNLLADRVREEGGFRVLVHVAGLSPTMGDFDRILRVNLVGPAMVQAALLPAVRPGSVAVLISSLAAHLCSFGPQVEAVLRDGACDLELPARLREVIGNERADSNTAYQLSKFGLVMLCRRRAADWGARAARIVSLSPGLIATPMGALEFASNPSKRALFEKSPQKREGTMEEIADAVEFLVSDRAAFISGTDLLVDGGLAGTLNDLPFRAP